MIFLVTSLILNLYSADDVALAIIEDEVHGYSQVYIFSTTSMFTSIMTIGEIGGVEMLASSTPRCLVRDPGVSLVFPVHHELSKVKIAGKSSSEF